MQKYMFIKRNGKATHQLGNVSRNFYPAELIIIHDETKTHWIGRYVDGIEFIDIQFDKNDCRDATEMEIKVWLNFKTTFPYEKTDIRSQQMIAAIKQYENSRYEKRTTIKGERTKVCVDLEKLYKHVGSALQFGGIVIHEDNRYKLLWWLEKKERVFVAGDNEFFYMVDCCSSTQNCIVLQHAEHGYIICLTANEYVIATFQP